MRKTRVKRKVTHELRRATNPEEKQEIVAEIVGEVDKEVEVAPKTRTPGITVGGSKVPYTYQDLVSMFPIVTFTPEVTCPLTFQGVRVQAFAGIEMHIPECFYRIYRQSRQRTRENKSLADTGFTNEIALGAGALPPE